MVKLSRAAEKTGGGLLVASAQSEQPKQGKVIACGPGTYHPDTGKLIPSPLKEGDLVLIADVAQTGEKVEYNGESPLVVGLDAVCGIPNQEKTR